MKNAILFMRLISTVLLTALTGTVVAQALGTDPLATMGVVWGLSEALAFTGVLRAGAFHTITISASTILTEFNTYYQNNGQNQSNIYGAFKRERSLPGLATQLMSKSDVAMLSNRYFTNVLQPFHGTWSHKGNATFRPNEHILRKCKVDQYILPDDIEQSYFGFLASLSTGDRSQWPVVRYIWEVMLAEQAGEDYEELDWAGVYQAAPGGGTPGDHTDLYDGIKELLVNGINHATRPMNEVTLTNDLSSASAAFDAVEEIVAALPQFWAKKQVDIVVSQRTHLYYWRDRRNTFNSLESRAATPGEPLGPIAVDGRPNWRLIPMGGMDMASDHAWWFATPKPNLIHWTKMAGWRMDMTREDRQVKVFADWFECLGFAVNEMVYTSGDPADSDS